MSSQETDQKTLLDKSSLFLDSLYCEEKYWDDDNDEEDDFATSNMSLEQEFSSSLEANEDDELVTLLSKEEKIYLDGSKLLVVDRKEALEWMIKVNAYHNFSEVTLVLSVSYFDRVMMNFGYKKDRPWMTQLVAIACFSLASKIEETNVPLLLDLIVENKYTFDAKTIQRMELLVLSTLEWKMYAVTPLSFLGHIITKLKLKNHLHWEIFSRCQSLIISAIIDPRFSCYIPSVLAVATTLLALKELGLGSNLENHIYRMETFKLNKEKIEECKKFINETSSNVKHDTQKRERLDSRNSPKNVLDAVFCERSKESIIMSSPEPANKRSRIIGPTHTHCFV